MSKKIANLLKILDLEDLERNLFRGHSPQSGGQRVFGGQVVSQALVAAQRTVTENRRIHSLHGYFVHPGDPEIPIIYEVERVKDGHSFTTRRVAAIQHGKTIFFMLASFQIFEEGLEYFMEMPNVPKPEDLASENELAEKFTDYMPENARRYWRMERPIEFRPINPELYISNKKHDSEQSVWMRATGNVPDKPVIHEAILAYASDMTLLDTALRTHGRTIFDSKLQIASLDHSLWFHRPPNIRDWHLYVQQSPNSSGARGFSRGEIYTQSGVLIASVAQEGLIRERPERFQDVCHSNKNT